MENTPLTSMLMPKAIVPFGEVDVVPPVGGGGMGISYLIHAPKESAKTRARQVSFVFMDSEFIRKNNAPHLTKLSKAGEDGKFKFSTN